ncbi:MAG TPA: hypothetical protein VF017_10465 [Thermoanaerobaculia bacterium]|nr:hypothetical protein [Thermoanaerobaculia bacterium]
MDDLEIIARFETRGEAQAAQSYLTACGIESHVSELDSLRLDPFHSVQEPPFRVSVAASQADAAREALEQVVGEPPPESA